MCVGIDFTLGDQKLPSGATDFARAKSFERAAPVSHVRPAYRCPMPAPADLWLYVNNQKRQGGCTSNLIVQPLETIVALSRFWELQPRRHDLRGHLRRRRQSVPGRPP